MVCDVHNKSLLTIPTCQLEFAQATYSDSLHKLMIGIGLTIAATVILAYCVHYIVNIYMKWKRVRDEMASKSNISVGNMLTDASNDNVAPPTQAPGSVVQKDDYDRITANIQSSLEKFTGYNKKVTEFHKARGEDQPTDLIDKTIFDSGNDDYSTR